MLPWLHSTFSTLAQPEASAGMFFQAGIYTSSSKCRHTLRVATADLLPIYPPPWVKERAVQKAVPLSSVPLLSTEGASNSPAPLTHEKISTCSRQVGEFDFQAVVLSNKTGKGRAGTKT